MAYGILKSPLFGVTHFSTLCFISDYSFGFDASPSPGRNQGRALNEPPGWSFPPLTYLLAGLFAFLGCHAFIIEYMVPTKSATVPDIDLDKHDLEDHHMQILMDIKSKVQSVDDHNDARELEEGLSNLIGKMDLLKDRGLNHSILRDADSFNQNPNLFTSEVKMRMQFDYNSKKKKWPYVGPASQYELDSLKKMSRAYLNALAVFPGARDGRYHGIVGLNPDGSTWYERTEMPPKVESGTPEEASTMKRGGGFYVELSDALPLDRDVPDSRNGICRTAHRKFDISTFPDASLIITFYNEPVSTLLRSVHSILNTTPPSLLREIILVDDHSSLSENLPGSPLDDAVDLLPKVHMLRLPHRHGLVQARLAGIKMAQGDVAIIFDSHVECQPEWIEPLLSRLRESPKSLVYPQIPSINSLTFEYENSRGLGCKLGFKWNMQEQGTNVGDHAEASPIPSATMAGGIFAVYRDFFWSMGGYDEKMTMWGAENVEMPFRYWQCGARVECMPCSRVHHIYRHMSSGYKSPSDTLRINRLRTAYLWTDEYYQLAKMVIGGPADVAVDIGPIDDILAFKEKKKCKNFHWFVNTLGLKLEPKDIEDVDLIGEIRNVKFGAMCLDTLAAKTPKAEFGVFDCHGMGGSQNWMSYGDGKIRAGSHDRLCMNHDDMKFSLCAAIVADQEADILFDLDSENGVIADSKGLKCLALNDNNTLVMLPCGDRSDRSLRWKWKRLEVDKNYVSPKHSQKWIDEHEKIRKRMEIEYESTQEEDEGNDGIRGRGEGVSNHESKEVMSIERSIERSIESLEDKEKNKDGGDKHN